MALFRKHPNCDQTVLLIGTSSTVQHSNYTTHIHLLKYAWLTIASSICMMSAAAWSRARGCCKVHTIPAGGGGSLWAPPAHTCAVTSEEEGGKIGGEASKSRPRSPWEVCVTVQNQNTVGVLGGGGGDEMDAFVMGTHSTTRLGEVSISLWPWQPRDVWGGSDRNLACYG